MDCIINEIYSVIARRSSQRGYSFKNTVSKMNKVIASIEIIKAYMRVEFLHDDIVKMMIRHNGLLNYHDCLICLTMNEKGLSRIVTLDKDFLDVTSINVIG